MIEILAAVVVSIVFWVGYWVGKDHGRAEVNSEWLTARMDEAIKRLKSIGR